ncbi:OmpA family protein [Flavobacterium pallidum]|uniref:OmpA-like domain-containing protein n=1 Tax=Flavobacterium pallidum TaxID=2172098 RepID=A0A2S1SFK2_9FLAO|nr:OmpA family protein [Flavobacterium pallidum]AWI25180.1 hypothetical protein HYN49_04315 [Flavobacterium pallidum]
MRSYFVSAALFFIAAVSAQQQKEILLYFDSGSYSLAPNGVALLDTFFVNDSITVHSIAIKGFCDDIGAENDNQALSVKRAQSTAAYIRSLSDKDNISISGKGEIQLAGDREANIQRQQNRKVSVLVSYTPNPKTETPTVKKPADVDLFEGYKMPGENLAKGDKFILRQLVFIASTTVFENAEACEAELEKYVQYFKANPEMKFEIHGHVCCISKSFRDARNIYTGKNNLSEDRAKRIYDYFIEKGIDKSRMLYKGFGRQFPRTDVAEKFNKRVEIVITQL